MEPTFGTWYARRVTAVQGKVERTCSTRIEEDTVYDLMELLFAKRWRRASGMAGDER